MGIEEKNKPLEFTFVPENIDDPQSMMSIDITYDPIHHNSLFSVTMKQGQTTITCPVEMFTEVVEFLSSKGILSMRNSGITQSGAIPVTEIDGEDEEIEHIDAAPFTSFDVSEIEEPEEKDVKETPTIKVGNEEVSSEEPIINRPVLKTRITNEENPLQAEKDAAILRQGGKKSKKSVKRVSD